MHPVTFLSCSAWSTISACSLNWIDPQMGFFSWISHVPDWLAGHIHEMSQQEADAIIKTKGISSVKLLPYPKGRVELDAPWCVALTVVK